MAYQEKREITDLKRFLAEIKVSHLCLDSANVISSLATCSIPFTLSVTLIHHLINQHSRLWSSYELPTHARHHTTWHTHAVMYHTQDINVYAVCR